VRDGDREGREMKGISLSTYTPQRGLLLVDKKVEAISPSNKGIGSCRMLGGGRCRAL
jgi:hypothetical protein